MSIGHKKRTGEDTKKADNGRAWSCHVVIRLGTGEQCEKERIIVFIHVSICEFSRRIGGTTAYQGTSESLS